MKLTEKFREFLEFNLWANKLLLESFQKSEKTDKNAVQIFGHLLLAEKEWFSRIADNKTDATGANFWAVETVKDCEKLFVEIKENYENFFATLSQEKIDRKITYKNSRGNEFSNSLDEVFSHVFFHSAQHRGQIIKIIRANGKTPPYIDFIGFLRSR